jgi:hypothetical protein
MTVSTFSVEGHCKSQLFRPVYDFYAGDAWLEESLVMEGASQLT